jgi:predicted O-methyltransferase YrrM
LGDWLFAGRSFFNYWLKKEDQYSLQSPFAFSIYSNLIQYLDQNKTGNPAIEEFRYNLLNDLSEIQVLDLGAGSKKVPKPVRRIADITRYSTSEIKFCLLYQFFCSLTPAECVVELGTCVGISTRYLSEKTKGRLFSFEGSPEIQKVAKRNPIPDRTEFILGKIQETLPAILDQIPKVDFALVDANHTHQGTLFAFESILSKIHAKSILAIGDIHWTAEMELAWHEIKAHPKVKLTLDFYECGVVFFENPGEKQDLILDI